jgi:hypothetical protein
MIYHKDIGFPASLVIPEVLLDLRYTRHAEERKNRDDYKLLVVPTVIRITKQNIVEAVTEDNATLKKATIRVEFDRTRDIVLVLEPLFNVTKAKVVTFWLNNKRDTHQTLDKRKYTKP